MKKIVLGVMAGIMLGLGLVAVPRPVMAEPLNLCDDPDFTDQALREAAGCRDTDEEKNKTIFGPVEIMIQVVLGIIGIVGVGVIIYGGIMYTISTGDSAKLAKAKNIILYGIIGLAVSGLAYAIVAFISQSIFG